jgi:hypothetical protein
VSVIEAQVSAEHALLAHTHYPVHKSANVLVEHFDISYAAQADAE